MRRPIPRQRQQGRPGTRWSALFPVARVRVPYPHNLMVAVKACNLLEYIRRQLKPFLTTWPGSDRQVLHPAFSSSLVGEEGPA